jgi:hypothetical protein
MGVPRRIDARWGIDRGGAGLVDRIVGFHVEPPADQRPDRQNLDEHDIPNVDAGSTAMGWRDWRLRWEASGCAPLCSFAPLCLEPNAPDSNDGWHPIHFLAPVPSIASKCLPIQGFRNIRRHGRRDARSPAARPPCPLFPPQTRKSLKIRSAYWVPVVVGIRGIGFKAPNRPHITFGGGAGAPETSPPSSSLPRGTPPTSRPAYDGSRPSEELQEKYAGTGHADQIRDPIRGV